MTISSFETGTNTGVKATPAPAGWVRVVDNKDPNSPILTFSSDEWDAFVAGVKANEFDRGVLA